MNNKFINKNRKLLPNARSLRENMTRQEKHLWYDFLKTYPVKFYKQKIIDNFIVDFYCHKAKLIIELDGSQHYEEKNESYDMERTKVLNKYGLSVIRFSNLDVDKNFEGVCVTIDEYIKNNVKPTQIN